MDENNPNQTPKEQITPPEQANKMLDDGTVVASSFVEGIDMDAINDAVDASKFTTANTPNDSINVEDIDLDDTPMSDEELNRQLEQDPTMSLAHSAHASTNSVVEAINDSQENMSSIAANLDRSAQPKEEEEEEKKEDPSIHDAPTVNEVIIAPPRKRSPIALILILILIIAAVAIGIIYFKK